MRPFALLLSLLALGAVAGAAEPAPSTAYEYELGGFFGPVDRMEVSIKKKDAPHGSWVRVGQTVGPICVESANPKKGEAIVRIHDTRYRVALRGESDRTERGRPPAMTGMAVVSYGPVGPAGAAGQAMERTVIQTPSGPVERIRMR